ncbi:DGQHR domain-containing protein [Caulobacter sp. DWP3-1-3b2]|uniref:DGQHR domain-containing protein n=1 Tax=Caulobacter sp. DWP3-1-3b2 TaxID=2804643 RepID=UPI003CEA72F4
MAKAGGKKGKKAPKVKKTPEQLLAEKEKRAKAKIKRDHEKLIQKLISATGFKQLTSLIDKQFTFKGQQSDFDDVFIYENVVIVVEYTASVSNIGEHLKLKKIPFDHIYNNQSDFIAFLKSGFPEFAQEAKSIYPNHSYRVVVLYCSRYEFKVTYKDQVTSAKYMDYNIAMYFSNLAATIRHSARHELLQFMDVPAGEVGMDVLNTQGATEEKFRGSVLPSSHSMFEDGYKVISFYANPAALLQRAYVLRREGWRDEAGLYQRIIGKKKVDLIRSYLLEKKRVFVNNIIVTIPDDAMIYGDDGHTQDADAVKKTQSATVSLPKRHNSIGIIDGQHRVFSYYEGGDHDEEIGQMRQVQNLLVTGVMFPPGTSDGDKLKFEARLFAEINANQTSVPPALLQEIDLILKPFSPISIAKRVITLMNDRSGPFNNEFARYSHDVEKIKTSSIVSFGLKQVVKLDSDESLFSVWDKPNKGLLLEGKDQDLLSEYVEFCFKIISEYFIEIRKALPNGSWVTSRKDQFYFLNTVNINGTILFQREILRAQGKLDPSELDGKLDFLKTFEFSKYKSSQYNRMSQDMYALYAASEQQAGPTSASV